MAQPQEAILAAGTSAAPLDYTIPPVQQLEAKAVHAIFDGTGASGSWVPVLQIVSDSGLVIANLPADKALPAGGQADVTWAPFLGRAGSVTLLGSPAAYTPWQDAYIAETTPGGPYLCTTSFAWASSGSVVLYSMPFLLPTGTVTNGVSFLLATAGAGATVPSNVQLCLVDDTGLVVAASGNIETTITGVSTGYKEALWTTFHSSSLYGGFYYIGDVRNGTWSTTTPLIGGYSTLGTFGAALPNAAASVGVLASLTGTITSVTAGDSHTIGSNASGNHKWFGLF